MSEAGFIAEARILVRPDTSRFRADLEAQLASVVRTPIKIPVVPIAGNAFTAAIAGTAALTAAQQQAAASTTITADALAAATTIQRQYTGAVDLSAVSVQGLAAAQEKETIAAKQSAAANASAARTQAGFARGAGASGLSLLGLRGATLAASGAFLAGTAAVVGFAKAVQSAASLETELNVFKANAGATADEMERVSEASKALGRDLTLPGVTAQTAAVAMTELSKAGLSVTDSLAGARGALQLSTAAQIDVATATNLVAGSLNAFQLAGTDAVKVADLLTGAAKESQGNISDMGTALSQAAAVSNQFGIRIEDTVTLLTQLAKAGLSGGRAGTSLRVAILRLVNPSADAAKALKELNVQNKIYNNQGNFNIHIFTEIQQALKGYSAEQRSATQATIFGSDAIRFAGITGAAGAKNYLTLRDAVTEAGLAQELAGARTKGLAGDFENLSNQASSFGLAIGQLATGPTSLLVRALSAEVGVLAESADALVTITREVKNYGTELVKAIPLVGDFKDALDDAFGGGDGGGGIGESIKSGLLTGLNLLPSILISVANHTKDAGKEARTYAGDVATATDALLGFQSALFGVAAIQRDNPLGGGKASGFNVERIQNIVQGFDSRQVRDKIDSDNTKLVSDLQAEQEFLLQQLQKQGVQNRPALKRALEQSLLGVVNDLKAIQDQAAAAAKAAKDKAAKIAKDLADAAAANAKALLNLRNSKLDLAIQRAGLTKGTADDKRAINAAIDRFQKDIDGLNRIKNKTVEQQQAVVDLKSKIVGLQQSLKSLSATQNGGDSFSLSDLFKEAVNNFQSFGSNIAGRSGVLSAQDTRGQLGGNILAQLGKEQLTESQKQTLLLTSIDQKVGGTAPSSSRGATRTPSYGELQGLRGAAMAAAYGYGDG